MHSRCILALCLLFARMVDVAACPPDLHFSQTGEHISIASVVDSIGQDWQSGDYQTLKQKVDAISSDSDGELSSLVLKMGYLLICKRDRDDYLRLKLVFEEKCVLRTNGDDIILFVKRYAGFDLWYDVADNDAEYEKMVGLCKSLRPGRFPPGEVAIWVYNR